MSKKKKLSTRRIAIFGLLTAILLIQNFVPFLGNIPIPPLNPTIIHITVIVATLTLGTVDGMILGGDLGRYPDYTSSHCTSDPVRSDYLGQPYNQYRS